MMHVVGFVSPTGFRRRSSRRSPSGVPRGGDPYCEWLRILFAHSSNRVGVYVGEPYRSRVLEVVRFLDFATIHSTVWGETGVPNLCLVGLNITFIDARKNVFLLVGVEGFRPRKTTPFGMIASSFVTWSQVMKSLRWGVRAGGKWVELKGA